MTSAPHFVIWLDPFNRSAVVYRLFYKARQWLAKACKWINASLIFSLLYLMCSLIAVFKSVRQAHKKGLMLRTRSILGHNTCSNCLKLLLSWSLNACNSLSVFQQCILPKPCCSLVVNNQLCPFSLLLLLHIHPGKSLIANGMRCVLCVTLVIASKLALAAWCHIGHQQSHYPPLSY